MCPAGILGNSFCFLIWRIVVVSSFSSSSSSSSSSSCIVLIVCWGFERRLAVDDLDVGRREEEVMDDDDGFAVIHGSNGQPKGKYDK